VLALFEIRFRSKSRDRIALKDILLVLGRANLVEFYSQKSNIIKQDITDLKEKYQWIN